MLGERASGVLRMEHKGKMEVKIGMRRAAVEKEETIYSA
jgi:hypothetical protein